jgi:hypothetical protein
MSYMVFHSFEVRTFQPFYMPPFMVSSMSIPRMFTAGGQASGVKLERRVQDPRFRVFSCELTSHG